MEGVREELPPTDRPPEDDRGDTKEQGDPALARDEAWTLITGGPWTVREVSWTATCGEEMSRDCCCFVFQDLIRLWIL